MQRDVDRVIVAHIASDAAAQGDLRVARGNGSAEFHLQFGGDSSELQAPREHPVGEFVDEGADDAAMQGLDPSVIVEAGRPSGDDFLAVLPKFQVQADGICRAAAEAVVALFVEIWIN